MYKHAIKSRFKSVWLLLGLASGIVLNAQTDSALAFARQSGNDSILIRALEKSVIPVVNKDPQKARAYAVEAIALSLEHPGKGLLARAYNAMGIVYDVSAKYDSALYMYRKSVENAPPIERSGFLGEPLNNIGLVYWNQGFNEKAIEHFTKSLEIFKAHNLDRGVAHNLNNIALVYQDMKRYQDALVYQKKALEIRARINDKYGLGASYSNLGNLYAEFEKYDSALVFFNKALEIKKKTNDRLGIAIAYNNLGVTYRSLGASVKAISFIQKGISIAKLVDANNQLLQDYCTLVKVYVEQGDHKTARAYLDSAATMAFDMGSQLRLRDYYSACLRLDSATGNIAGLAKNWPKFYRLNQAIYNLEAEEAISTIQAKYETAEKEAEIARSKAQIAEQSLMLKARTVWIVVLTSFFLLAIFAGLAIRHQAKLRQQKLVAENALKEEKSRAELREKIQEERQRIGRDLHDHIGAQLTIITSSLDALAYKEGANKSNYDQISNQTRETMGQLRETIWAMSNEHTSVEALSSKLRESVGKLASLLEEQKIHISVSGNGHALLGPAKTIAVFRMCQEALNNALKHADFKTLDISFNIKKGRLTIEVTDDGKGFDPTVMQSDGYGLNNMRHRIEEVGGDFSLHSEEGKGTRIKAELPV